MEIDVLENFFLKKGDFCVALPYNLATHRT